MKRFVKIPIESGEYSDQYGTRFHVKDVTDGSAFLSPYTPQEAESLEAFLQVNGLFKWQPW